MDWKEYKYYAQLAGNDIVYRPIVGVELFDGKTWYAQHAMLDSGCDKTMLDADFAKLLGIDPTNCRKIKIGGIVGETVEAFEAKVTLKIEGFDEPFDLLARFVPNMKISALLGHNDFFDKFKVKFEKKHKKFYLQKEK